MEKVTLLMLMLSVSLLTTPVLSAVHGYEQDFAYLNTIDSATSQFYFKKGVMLTNPNATSQYIINVSPETFIIETWYPINCLVA